MSLGDENNFFVDVQLIESGNRLVTGAHPIHLSR